MTRRPVCCTFLTVLLSVWSCRLGLPIPGLRGPSFGPKVTFRVDAASAANLNSPVAVDLVLVYDKKLVEELLAMPAADWFEKRNQFERDSMGKKRLEFRSWEWAPGQELETEVRYSRKGNAAFLFARYLTPGDHRIRIDPYETFRLVLGENQFQVVVPENR